MTDFVFGISESFCVFGWLFWRVVCGLPVGGWRRGLDIGCHYHHHRHHHPHHHLDNHLLAEDICTESKVMPFQSLDLAGNNEHENMDVVLCECALLTAGVLMRFNDRWDDVRHDQSDPFRCSEVCRQQCFSFVGGHGQRFQHPGT